MNKDYIIINGELYHADELYHYGVKGMKWGVRNEKEEARYQKKVKNRMIIDAYMSKVKARPDQQYASNYGRYHEDKGSYTWLTYHYYDHNGKPILSYHRDKNGRDIYLAADKESVSKSGVLQKEFRRRPKDEEIEYGVYKTKKKKELN